jgi:hypothetical protein
VIDCSKEQHERLQELIGLHLAKDRLPNRSHLGEGVESGECWADLGVYSSEIANKQVDDRDGTGTGNTVRACVKGGKKDAKPETKIAPQQRPRPQEQAGWPRFQPGQHQHSGKKDAKPETKKRDNYDLDPKNKDGIEDKWQHMGKKDAELETKKANNYALNSNNEDGWPRLQVGACQQG